MSKKQLDTKGVMSELTGQSAFFRHSRSAIAQEKIELVKPQQEEPTEDQPAVAVDTKQADTMTPSNHDTTVSRYHDTVVEALRKAVKEFGKEAATHRFTEQEKDKIAEIVYQYKRLGIRTSENEITRIAINFLADDYNQHGLNSLLDRVLKALYQ